MRLLRLFTLAATLILINASNAPAQDRVIFGPSNVVVSGPMPRYGALSSPVVYPYSYYATTGNAREYVPYGANDSFAFYGRPYGHAYDRWSWSTFAGTNAAPARYFYEPLR